MPTKRQLSKSNESQFEFPATRRDDDPCYSKPIDPEHLSIDTPAEEHPLDYHGLNYSGGKLPEIKAIVNDTNILLVPNASQWVDRILKIVKDAGVQVELVSINPPESEIKGKEDQRTFTLQEAQDIYYRGYVDRAKGIGPTNALKTYFKERFNLDLDNL